MLEFTILQRRIPFTVKGACSFHYPGTTKTHFGLDADNDCEQSSGASNAPKSEAYPDTRMFHAMLTLQRIAHQRCTCGANGTSTAGCMLPNPTKPGRGQPGPRLRSLGEAPQRLQSMAD